MTTPIPAFDQLTAAQQATLLTATNPVIGAGVELINFDQSVGPDLTDYLDLTTGGVQWDGSNLVPRQANLNLAYQLPWGASQLRVYRTITDPVSGLTARRNRGVFCPTTPDQPVGSTVNINGADRTAYSVTGSDRSSLLDRLPGYSVVAPMSSGGSQQYVVTNLGQVETQSGVLGFLNDPSAAMSLQPTDMVWPMLPLGSDDTSSTDNQTVVSGIDPMIVANADTGDSATWRQIVNDLQSLISYRAVWCDRDGNLRCGPYADPSTQAPIWTLDATAFASPVSQQRTISQDVWGVPNQWTFSWTNMPPDASGNPQTASLDNGGVIVLYNDADGLSSKQARNNLSYPQTYNLTAATLADFQAQCAAQKAKDLRTVKTYKFSLHPVWCVLEHFDVVTLIDPAIPGGSAKVQIVSWSESLDNSDIEVTAVSV